MITILNKIINGDKLRVELKGWRKMLKNKSNGIELVKVAKKIKATNVRF